MSEISEKTKIWLFKNMENARLDMREESYCHGYGYQQASEKYGHYCEIVAGLGLMDEFWKGGWDENR